MIMSLINLITSDDVDVNGGDQKTACHDDEGEMIDGCHAVWPVRLTLKAPIVFTRNDVSKHPSFLVKSMTLEI
jgi:hypothetical protein